ncbi:unnamed protein product [Diatraea saccharalis]|uniref:Allatostatin CC n=1 Tax=Diatraea saccharalis TaxID=40085 RepID=A0A9N9R000_9NEOP|nr:unnamed protein product [Diatraea saccharalis]
MMRSPVPLLLVALSAALAAPPNTYEDYPITVPQKRAALVLDRLLIALQKALHDNPPPSYEQVDSDGPRTAPLRVANDLLQNDAIDDSNREVWLEPEDLSVEPLRLRHEDLTGLQRRGQSGGAPGVRGRVLRCYFNAITCF